MDNPFEEDNDVSLENKNNALDNEINVLLWKEKKGRKTNTYASGWNIDESELKQYLKEFKKSHGCNGSIKSDEENLIMHLQGDKVDDVAKFMVSKGVKEENIRLKGQ
tara:strand:+ start:527 stop:847 length:321 start_codon:yes stop_codon:yes gene_type:complete